MDPAIIVAALSLGVATVSTVIAARQTHLNKLYGTRQTNLSETQLEKAARHAENRPSLTFFIKRAERHISLTATSEEITFTIINNGKSAAINTILTIFLKKDEHLFAIASENGALHVMHGLSITDEWPINFPVDPPNMIVMRGSVGIIGSTQHVKGTITIGNLALTNTISRRFFWALNYDGGRVPSELTMGGLAEILLVRE